jgi:hypothetical protein
MKNISQRGYLMKKFICSAILILTFISLPLFSSASEINNTGFGITYTISDSWYLVSDDKVISYQHMSNNVEGIVIECIKNDGAYNIDNINKDFLFDICNEQWCSDERLSRHLTQRNNRQITVTTNAVKVSYETYNNIKYFLFVWFKFY